MGAVEPIRVDGLREFQRSLRQMDADLPKQLRVILNQAAQVVVDYAVPRIPRATGAAAGSVKVRSSQRESRVAMGGRRAPYMPWLDFGGRTGPGRSVNRPFMREGRYLYVGLRVKRDEVTELMESGLRALGAGAGLEVR